MFFGPATVTLWIKSKFDNMICSPRIELSNGLSYTLKKDRMQMLQPREVDVPTYPSMAT
jgi:hypothetical protein